MFAIRKGNTVTIAPLEDALVGLQSGWAIRFADKPQFLFHVSRQNLDGSSMTMDQAIGNCARIARREGLALRSNACGAQIFEPGFLIPSDLERMMPSATNPLLWANNRLLASPGAKAVKHGSIFRIHTLVSAVKRDGSCINLVDGRCAIHDSAPFGCAFFDCGPERGSLSHDGLMSVAKACTSPSLYRTIWNHLWTIGRRQQAPDVLRRRMGETL